MAGSPTEVIYPKIVAYIISFLLEGFSNPCKEHLSNISARHKAGAKPDLDG